MKAEMSYVKPVSQLSKVKGAIIMQSIININPQTRTVLSQEAHSRRENNSKPYDLLFSMAFCFSLSIFLAACFC
jgi:5-methylcytosine-specific restriction endonuclease McrBC regulatory subunit McrC